jgi:hypothetical protein
MKDDGGDDGDGGGGVDCEIGVEYNVTTIMDGAALYRLYCSLASPPGEAPFIHFWTGLHQTCHVLAASSRSLLRISHVTIIIDGAAVRECVFATSTLPGSCVYCSQVGDGGDYYYYNSLLF